METHARIRNFLTLASLAAALTISSPRSFADDKREPDAKTRTAALKAMEGYDLVIAGGVLIEADGRRSTAELSAVVDALRKRYSDANIVYPPELGSIMLADLKLHAHDLPEMLEALRVASGGKFDWMGPGSPGLNQAPPKRAPGVSFNTIDPRTGLPIAQPPSDPNTGLYTLREPMRGADNERVVEAFNISSYIQSKQQEARTFQYTSQGKVESVNFDRALIDQTLKDLEELIVQTVANFKQTSENEVRNNLKFQFHSGAMLLIVIGPRTDVDPVRKLMGALVTEPDGQRVNNRLRMDLAPPAEQALPITVENFSIRYAKMEAVFTAANSLLSDKRSKVVISDDRTKTLIVAGTKSELDTIKKALEELDVASKPYAGDNPADGHRADGHNPADGR